MTARPEYVTAKQLAAMPDMPFENARAVWRAHDHDLPRVTIGRKCVYSVDAVRAYLASCRHGDWPAERPDLRAVV